MTTANTTIAAQCEWIKIVRLAKIFFLECCRILAISLGVPWNEKGWKLLYDKEKENFRHSLGDPGVRLWKQNPTEASQEAGLTSDNCCRDRSGGPGGGSHSGSE